MQETSNQVRVLARKAQHESLIAGGLAAMRLHLEAGERRYKFFIAVPGLAATQLRAEIMDDSLVLYSCGHTLAEGVERLQRPLFMYQLPIPPDVDPAGIEARIFSGGLYIELQRLSGPRRRNHRVLPIVG